MKVDVLASQLHYEDHLAAIWMALPAEVRGGWYAQGPCANAGNRQGVPGWKPGSPPLSRDLLLVAGYVDERNGGPRPTIYVEHGGGQTYQGLVDPSYSGSGGHEQVVLFLSPSEMVAARWRARYPTVPAAAVGCPKLDWHHAHPERVAGRTLAVAFHSRNRLLPETDSAFDDYEIGMGPAVQEPPSPGVAGAGPRPSPPLVAAADVLGADRRRGRPRLQRGAGAGGCPGRRQLQHRP